MNAALYRYWLIPAGWRRRPRPLRLGLAFLIAVGVLRLSCVPFTVWRPQKAWQGMSGYEVFNDGVLFLLCVNVVAALAGATAIAGEREHGTWESLLLTPIGVRALVRAKLISRCILVGGLVSLSLPFWLMWAYQVLEVNNDPEHPLTIGGALSGAQVATRMGIFLFWLAARIVGRVLPFTALGLAVSARCNQVRRAMIFSAGIVIAIGTAILSEIGIFAFLLNLGPDLPTSMIGRILFWPLLPNDFLNYTESGLLSQLWRSDLAADAVWLIVLPYVLTRLAVTWGRRPDRVLDWFERRAHGF